MAMLVGILSCTNFACQEPCDSYTDPTFPFEVSVSDASGNTNLQANVEYELGAAATVEAACAFLIDEPMNCLAWVGETNTSGSFMVHAWAEGWEAKTVQIDVAWDDVAAAPVTEWRNIILTPTEDGT